MRDTELTSTSVTATRRSACHSTITQHASFNRTKADDYIVHGNNWCPGEGRAESTLTAWRALLLLKTRDMLTLLIAFEEYWLELGTSL